MDIKKIEFQQHGDSRGMLVVAEYQKEIPFTVKRIYYIYGADSETRRGFHSHKNLQQIYIAIHGSCRVTLTDGKTTETVCLDDAASSRFRRRSNGLIFRIFSSIGVDTRLFVVHLYKNCKI